MTVTIIVVLELILCAGWISQSNAQVSATIFPQEHQSVCRGRYISYDCIGNGVNMDLYSPPIVNESNLIGLFVNSPIPTCNVVPDSAAAMRIIDSSGSSSFVGTLTLFISNGQSEGERRVYCRVLNADGSMEMTDSTTYSVLGPPSLAATNTINSSVIARCDNATQVTVNISWDSPDNAQEFTLTISNLTYGYMSTIRSLENRATALLPCGTYAANLCVINRCGKVCQNLSDPLIVECGSRTSQPETTSPPNPQSRPETASPPSQPEIASPPSPQSQPVSLVVAAIIAGVMGVLFIFAVIYGVIITVKLHKMKKEHTAPSKIN